MNLSHRLDRWPLRAALAVTFVLSLLAIAPGGAPTPAAAATQTVTISSFGFNPTELTINQGDTVTWTNTDRAARNVTEDTRLWDSRSMTQFQTFSYTFSNSGRYNYYDDTRPAIRGSIVVVPTVSSGTVAPPKGATISDFGPTLQWTNPSGTQQVQVQVIPANNDGPGVDVVLGSPVTSFAIPAPPQWYGLLPDMTYTWRVRSTTAEVFVPQDHPSWTPWVSATFRTPAVDSAGITAVAPSGTAASRTPTLTWANNSGDVYYYELQLSKDSSFNMDAATAVASVYGALIHGGVSTPPNSYTVPAAAPLEPNTTYYWRVRPRVQGDASPLIYSRTFSFRTP